MQDLRHWEIIVPAINFLTAGQKAATILRNCVANAYESVSMETLLQTCLMISANLGEEKIMGGFSSGRGQSDKDTSSDYRALDVRCLQRDGLLTPQAPCRQYN